MRKPVASIFIAMLAAAAGASAQNATNPAKPQLVVHQPATVPPPGVPAGANAPVGVNAATQPRSTRDSAQLTPAEQERVERQGGQPLLWLKNMAAAHNANQAANSAPPANRKAQAGTADKKSQAKSR